MIRILQPRKIYLHILEGGVPQKNFFVGFPNISWAGAVANGVLT